VLRWRLVVLDGRLRLIAVARALLGTIVGGSKWLKIQDLWFILIEGTCDGTALPSFLGIEGQHTCNSLIQVIAILFFECTKQAIEPIFSELPRSIFVHVIAILQSPTGQDSQPNAENLSKRRVDMRGVVSLLDEVVVDLFRCQVDIINDLVLFFEEQIVVIQLSWEGDGTDDLDLPALVDENVHGVYVTYLFLQVFELTTRTDDVIQQIPHLCL
jgi:hypothetical protein